MDVFDALKGQGYAPKANEDVDFPPISGEYAVTVSKLTELEDAKTGEKVGYTLELTINQTLSGDTADGRKMWQRYRTGGTDFNGNPISQEDGAKALKQLANDLYTMGVKVDLSSKAAFEAGFPAAVGATGFIRAYHFPSKEDKNKKVQRLVIKLEKDLKKASKEGAASSAVPF